MVYKGSKIKKDIGNPISIERLYKYEQSGNFKTISS